MKFNKDLFIFIIFIISIIIGSYTLGFLNNYGYYKYYKDKSEKEQRLLWRISYTFPEEWELIKNTPEYYPCIQYNIEDINEY